MEDEMYLGDRIKRTREKLGLIQMNLQTPNLSRNLLSGIEHNKTTLTPAKALILYKQFIDYSWIRDIEIDIHFDEVLDQNQEYKKLKEANQVCHKLYHMIKHDEMDSLEVDYNILDQYRNVDLGMLGFSIPYFLGQIAYKRKELKRAQKLYYKALDNLIVTRRIDVIENFRDCAYDLLLVCRALNDEKQVLKYYKHIEYMCLASKQEVPAGILYNLSLYSEISGEFEQAISYLNDYSELELNTYDRIEARIMKANIYSSMKELTKSSAMYIDILSTESEISYEYQALCLGNVINDIIDSDSTVYDDNISEYRAKLMDIIKSKTNTVYNYKQYSSIARSYEYFDDYENAYEYYVTSFKSIDHDHDFNKTITVLLESYATFKKLGHLDDFISLILKVSIDKINCKSKVQLLTLIAKLQADLLQNQNQNLNKLDALISYISNFNY